MQILTGKYSMYILHIDISVKAIYTLFRRLGLGMRDAGVSDYMSQAFLDKVGHQNLRSLLILHQNIMRGGDLVTLKAIQQCNTNHSR